MDVESRESTIYSGFFHSKHSVTIAEHKKLHPKGFLQGIWSQKIPSNHEDTARSDTGPGKVEATKKILKII